MIVKLPLQVVLDFSTKIDSEEESKSSLGSVQVGCGQNPLLGDGVASTRS